MTSTASCFDSALTGALSGTRICQNRKSVSSDKSNLTRLLRCELQVEIILIVLESQDLGFDELSELPLQGLIVERGACLQLLVRERVGTAVELEQDASLVARNHEGIFLVEIGCPKLVSRLVPEPGDLASAVLLVVELLEALQGLLQLRGAGGVGCRRSERP